MRVPTLSDGVVTLRAHSEDDIDRVVEQCVDLQSIEWTVVPIPYTRDDAKQFVRHAMPGGWETDQEWGFAVEYDGRFAGTVSLRNRDDGRAEVAYGSHPDVRGRGVISRAVRLVLEWGFSPSSEGGRDLHAVSWLAHRGNWASRRLAWATGFSFDGTRKDWFERRGERWDMWMGSLRRGDPMTPPTPWLEPARIVGRSVVLRSLADQDLPRIVETLNDRDTQAWMERPRVQAPHTLESQADFVLGRLEQAAACTGLHWAVADPATDTYLGQMTLFAIQHRRQAELGYWTHPDARGRGLTTEAARLVVRHCFVPWEDGGLGMRRLFSDADLSNSASRRILEGAGFVQTGVDRASEPRRDGTWADVARYDLLAAELPRLPSRDRQDG